MSDRGTYRAIKIVLLDGPDFQGLPERSRHLFQTLKLTFGPTGIEVRYPGALEAELSAKTGIPVEAVSGPLDTLEEREWINREGNIVWIVGQLKHDPHMSWDDDKHRKSVWRHLQGLPRLAIVGEFVRCYRRWFEAGESVTVRNDPKPLAPAPHDLLCWLDDTPSKAHQRPIEGPSKAHGRPFGGPGPSSDPDSNLLSVDNRSSRLSDAIPSDPTRPIEGPSEALARPIEAPSTEYALPCAGSLPQWLLRLEEAPSFGEGARRRLGTTSRQICWRRIVLWGWISTRSQQIRWAAARIRRTILFTSGLRRAARSTAMKSHTLYWFPSSARTRLPLLVKAL